VRRDGSGLAAGPAPAASVGSARREGDAFGVGWLVWVVWTVWTVWLAGWDWPRGEVWLDGVGPVGSAGGTAPAAGDSVGPA
jgi:hypothetical protein